MSEVPLVVDRMLTTTPHYVHFLYWQTFQRSKPFLTVEVAMQTVRLPVPAVSCPLSFSLQEYPAHKNPDPRKTPE
jgi:hypothetical protein